MANAPADFLSFIYHTLPALTFHLFHSATTKRHNEVSYRNIEEAYCNPFLTCLPICMFECVCMFGMCVLPLAVE